MLSLKKYKKISKQNANSNEKDVASDNYMYAPSLTLNRDKLSRKQLGPLPQKQMYNVGYR